jgi:DoxX-like family
MMAASHLSTGLVPMMGLLEIAIAACAVFSWRRRSFFLVNIVAMLVALGNVAIMSPSYLVAAFNPVTLNLAMIALSLVGYIAATEIPSASRCLRQPPKEST